MSTTPPPFLHPFARPAAGADQFLTIVRGDGAVVEDAGGRTYIDAMASLWYCQVGHGRREIVDAIASQAERLATFHTFDRFTNEPADALAAALTAIAPMDGARVFFTSSGSEAEESALKLARFAHHAGGDGERTVVLSRAPSYHGAGVDAEVGLGEPPPVGDRGHLGHHLGPGLRGSGELRRCNSTRSSPRTRVPRSTRRARPAASHGRRRRSGR